MTGFTINSKFKNSNIIFLIAQFVNIVQITSQEYWIIKRNGVSDNTEEQRKISLPLQHQLKRSRNSIRQKNDYIQHRLSVKKLLSYFFCPKRKYCNYYHTKICMWGKWSKSVLEFCVRITKKNYQSLHSHPIIYKYFLVAIFSTEKIVDHRIT